MECVSRGLTRANGGKRDKITRVGDAIVIVICGRGVGGPGGGGGLGGIKVKFSFGRLRRVALRQYIRPFPPGGEWFLYPLRPTMVIVQI